MVVVEQYTSIFILKAAVLGTYTSRAGFLIQRLLPFIIVDSFVVAIYIEICFLFDILIVNC